MVLIPQESKPQPAYQVSPAGAAVVVNAPTFTWEVRSSSQLRV